MGDGGKVDNPWLGLDQQALDGTLKLSHGAALDAAKLAADAVNVLNTARGYQSLLTDHKGFSDNSFLPRIMVLRDHFNHEGGRLDTILGHYVDLVNAMADTLIVADKEYNAAEEDSKTKFERFKKELQTVHGAPTMATGTKIPTFDTDKTPPLDAKHGYGGLADVRNSTGHYESIDPEDPNSGGHDWFYRAGFGMNPQSVADASGTWLIVADKIDTSFENLTKRLSQMESDGSWTGTGAKGAIRAAGNFKTQADGLTSDLRAMASNLSYVSGWLANTKLYMPNNAPTDFDYDRPQHEDAIVKRARLGFSSWYVPGLSAASTAIPKLADPTAPMPGSDGKTNYYGGSDDGGDRGGTRGKIGPSGGGTPSFGDGSLPGGTAPKVTANKATNPPGSTPNGGDKGGTNPNGGDKNGSNPNGGNPNGSNPDGSNPGGSNPTSSQNSQSGSQLSQMAGTLQQALQGLQSQTQQSTQQQDLAKKLQNMPLSALPNLNDLKMPGGGPGGGGPGGKPTLEPAQAKLFPRAALAEVAEAEAAGVARAGIAAGATPMGGGMGGGMGGMGHGGGAHGAQGKEHKRPEFLDSSEYLDEAMGTPPVVAKPVVEG
ncbi:hypothetical protein ACFXPS_12430 [Nocardia sp. NPDC059091]|uniref:hypothetical protein n=1 Tax=unclassified Nocardia TaxID=2637762 RepID=UPI0036A8E044